MLRMETYKLLCLKKQKNKKPQNQEKMEPVENPVVLNMSRNIRQNIFWIIVFIAHFLF